MEGWIKLHRKLIEWEWYSDQNTKSLFIHCLIKANIKDKVWRGVIINKGQFFTSIGNLAFELGLSVKQIRISISKLEGTGDIVHEGASKGTKITVCNYSTYQWNVEMKGQAEGQTKGKQRASKGQQHKKEEKEENNNIEYRQQKFIDDLSLFSDKYDRDILRSFFDYWSEPNKAKTKMRFEMQPTWELSRRLITWFNNSNKKGYGRSKQSGASNEAVARIIAAEFGNDSNK